MESRLSLLTLSRNACIYRVSLTNGFWVSSEVKLATKNDKQPLGLLSAQAFSAYVVIRSQSVDLIDLHSSKIIHTFMTEPMQQRSFKFVYSGQRMVAGCRGTVSSLTLAYDSELSGDCVLQTYLPDEAYDNICFSDANGPPARSSCTWSETRQITRRVKDPGCWTTLRNGSIVGVRRVQEALQVSNIRNRLPAFAQSGLRRRGHVEPAPVAQKWETWVFTQLEKDGNFETRPCATSQDTSGLIISELGPMVRVGHGSVAVGFGNIIKVITVGHEWYDNMEEEGLRPDTTLMASRRRKGLTSRARATSASFNFPNHSRI